MKIVKRRASIILLLAAVLTSGQCKLCFSDEISGAIIEFKQNLTRMNKYQLIKNLNTVEAVMTTDPGNYYIIGTAAAIKNQMLYHDQLVLQVRGLIQSGIAKGHIGVDGAVFISAINQETGDVIQISSNEFAITDLEEFIRKQSEGQVLIVDKK